MSLLDFCVFNLYMLEAFGVVVPGEQELHLNLLSVHFLAFEILAVEC